LQHECIRRNFSNTSGFYWCSSGIDPEVLSQVGTRFTLQLLDDSDIDAVFQGVGGGARLKKILRSIESQ
jgi:hypothetical protein